MVEGLASGRTEATEPKSPLSMLEARLKRFSLQQEKSPGENESENQALFINDDALSAPQAVTNAAPSSWRQGLATRPSQQSMTSVSSTTRATIGTRSESQAYSVGIVTPEDRQNHPPASKTNATPTERSRVSMTDSKNAHENGDDDRPGWGFAKL